MHSMKEPNRIPEHIAIIMDGNGRWARARGQERIFGHMQGVESIRQSIKGAIRNGVRYLTLYAFSKENWGRPHEEVDGLMEIFCKCAVNETPELKRLGVKTTFIGDTATMNDEIRQAIDYCVSETVENTVLNVFIALNYSSRWEIANAAKNIAEKVARGELFPGEIDEKTLSSHLMTAGVPDPDLVIRTSGEHRLSNFLLWQSAYSEFYYTDVLWPDFDEREFEKALQAYQRRNRRFGTVK